MPALEPSRLAYLFLLIRLVDNRGSGHPYIWRTRAIFRPKSQCLKDLWREASPPNAPPTFGGLAQILSFLGGLDSWTSGRGSSYQRGLGIAGSCATSERIPMLMTSRGISISSLNCSVCRNIESRLASKKNVPSTTLTLSIPLLTTKISMPMTPSPNVQLSHHSNYSKASSPSDIDAE